MCLQTDWPVQLCALILVNDPIDDLPSCQSCIKIYRQHLRFFTQPLGIRSFCCFRSFNPFEGMFIRVLFCIEASHARICICVAVCVCVERIVERRQ